MRQKGVAVTAGIVLGSQRSGSLVLNAIEFSGRRASVQDDDVWSRRAGGVLLLVGTSYRLQLYEIFLRKKGKSPGGGSATLASGTEEVPGGDSGLALQEEDEEEEKFFKTSLKVRISHISQGTIFAFLSSICIASREAETRLHLQLKIAAEQRRAADEALVTATEELAKAEEKYVKAQKELLKWQARSPVTGLLLPSPACAAYHC
jgi:hypothetical protein